MALTIANECRKAGLDGITVLLNSGKFVLQATGPSTLATLTFGATAFAAASTASPSVAASNAITADNAPTAGTVTLFQLQTSGSAVRINGTVGVGSGDLQVSNNVIPGTATSVTCTGGLSLSLQLA
jgi:hypothetical protein